MTNFHKLQAIIQILNIVNIVWEAYNVYLKSPSYRHRRTLKRIRDEPSLSNDPTSFFEFCAQKLELNNGEEFIKAIRMDASKFELLLSLLHKRLIRFSHRRPIAPDLRLAVTLAYLAQGYSFQLLARCFKLGLSTVRKIVYDTCESIWDELHPVYLAIPNAIDWEHTSQVYFERTGMPNCLGAIDGKVINIICPKRSGDTKVYKYKKRFSVVLLAACDADYSFTLVDVGAVGGHGDSGVFSRSSFGRKILENTLLVPEDKNLPSSDTVFPHYFIADGAFPLRTNLMHPFPGRDLPFDKNNFNLTLSKAREPIQIAFSILANRWTVLHTTIPASPKNIDKIVLATTVLHNFLMFQRDRTYFTSSDAVITETDESKLPSTRLCYPNRSSQQAFELRNILKEFLCDTVEYLN